MDTPTTKDFRIGELKAIIADTDNLRSRIANHHAYLSDPVLAETHRADCRDNDVVTANLALAMAAIDDARRQLALALRITDPPQRPVREKPPKPEPEAENPVAVGEAS